MLTFTRQVNPEFSTFTLAGTIIDHDGQTVEVGEWSMNEAQALKSLIYYMTAFDNVTVSCKAEAVE